MFQDGLQLEGVLVLGLQNYHQETDFTFSILSFSVTSIFTNIDNKFFKKQQQIPDQKIIQTPYGGRLVVTMPHGNNIVVHYKDKERIRHKKRWSQVGK